MSPDRVLLELPLLTMLGLQLQVTDGYAASAAKEAYTRARDLCSLYPGPPPRFPVLWGLWLFSKVRSELTRAQELANELDAIARELNDPSLQLQAHQALGMTAFCRGEPAQTRRHVEAVAEQYRPERHRQQAFQFGQDTGVICKAFGAVALWLLGQPDSALRESEAALAMSRGLSPSSQVVALHFASMVHHLRRDPVRTRELAEASASIAAEHGLAFWRAGALVMSGWALAANGEEQGIERLRQGLLDWQATGSVTYRTYFLGLLAEVLGKQGKTMEALWALDEAMRLVRQTDEGLYEPELHRLRGELLLRSMEEPDTATRHRVEQDFRKALDIARQREARSLALRAACSLARLQRVGPGQTLLGDIIASFTEGFRTPDLMEARDILAG